MELIREVRPLQISQFRPIPQALRLQTLACWRFHNRFAKSFPHSRLDIMDIKPPLPPCLGLLPALTSFVSVLLFHSPSPAESTHAESATASPFESTHAKTPGVGGPTGRSSLPLHLLFDTSTLRPSDSSPFNPSTFNLQLCFPRPPLLLCYYSSAFRFLARLMPCAGQAPRPSMRTRGKEKP